MEKVKHSYSSGVLKIMSIFSGVQMIGIICGVIRSKLVAVWIGAAGVGLFGIFNSAIEMIAGLALLGIDTSAVRSMAAAEPSEKPLMGMVVRRWGRILAALGGVMMVALSPLLSVNSFGTKEYAWQFALLGVCIVLNVLTRTRLAVLQGFQRYSALARASMWGAVGGVAVSAPLFYFFGISSIVPALIGFATVSYLAARANSLRLPRLEINRGELWTRGRDFLRLGMFLTISAAAANLVNYLFMSWLNEAAGVDTVGYYQAGYTLFYRYAGLVFTAIAVEYYPRLSSVAHKHRAMTAFVNHEATLLMWILLGIVPLFIVAAPLMVRILYSDDFLVAVPLVALGITGTVLRGVSWCMSFTILARNDGRIFVLTEILSELLALGFNIWGYLTWGLTGLGIAYILWYAAYTVIVGVVYVRRYRLRFYRSTALLATSVFTASGLCAAAAVSGMSWWVILPAAGASAVIAGMKLRRLYR